MVHPITPEMKALMADFNANQRIANSPWRSIDSMPDDYKELNERHWDGLIEDEVITSKYVTRWFVVWFMGTEVIVRHVIDNRQHRSNYPVDKTRSMTFETFEDYLVGPVQWWRELLDPPPGETYAVSAHDYC